MSSDIVTYLNGPEQAPMYSRLLAAIKESKQGKASAGQWLATVNSLTTKGVKLLELQDSGLLTYLETVDPKVVLTREALLEEAQRRYVTVKEVKLGSPKFATYRQPGGFYEEHLYILNSQRANIEDDIEEINFQLEEYVFDPTLIARNPGALLALEKRRGAMMRPLEDAYDFQRHHFSEKVNGKHGKNLMAHCRVSVHGSRYLVNEIQSDWAQKGRAADWGPGFPRAPFVTNTENWAGLVLRRQMQIAASDPGITEFLWITESMKNGGRQNRANELLDNDNRKKRAAFVAEYTAFALRDKDLDSMPPAEAAALRAGARQRAEAAANAEGLLIIYPMNDFYVAMLPKLAEKAISKAGGRVTMRNVTLDVVAPMGAYGAGTVQTPNVIEVPGFEMTPAIRDVLSQQAMYSRTRLLRFPPLAQRDAAIADCLRTATEMLGSAKHLRFAEHVYDVASGRKVAGRTVNALIQVSLHAADMAEVTRHECFHWASEHLFRSEEVALVKENFAPGSRLNFAIRLALTQRQDFAAAEQCNNPLEAAAHAYALWERGQISITEPAIKGLFADLFTVLRDAVRWLKRVVLEHRATTVEELFQSLASGEMAAAERVRGAPGMSAGDLAGHGDFAATERAQQSQQQDPHDPHDPDQTAPELEPEVQREVRRAAG